MVSTLHHVTRPYEEPGSSGFPPRYHVIEEQDGFRIEGRERHPVLVRLSPARTTFVVVGAPDELGAYDAEHGAYDTTGAIFGLHNYRGMLNAVAKTAMRDWQRPQNPPSHWSGITEWAIGRTQRALHYSGVYSQWQRLLSLVPQMQRDVSKAVFAATFTHSAPGYESWPALYEHGYLVRDIVQYRAAAVACHYADRLVDTVGQLVTQQAGKTAGGCMENSGDAFQSYHAQYARLLRFPSASLTVWQGRRELQREVLRLLALDWKSLYSGSGSAGTSLRRTLMNLPGRIPGKLLCGLPLLDSILRRPVTDRLELLLLLKMVEHAGPPFWSPVEADLWERDIYARASRRQILSALHMLSKHLRYAVLPKSEGLSTLVHYIGDYCFAVRRADGAAHNGTLVGLCEKAIDWHRETQEAEVKRILAKYDPQTPTACPPVPFPTAHGVRFLRTIEDIRQEGISMNHCIASYAESAIQGSCYLFHVEHNQSHASVQVYQNGYVAQSYGPHNVINAASQYGRRVLTRWARTFAQDPLGDPDEHPF